MAKATKKHKVSSEAKQATTTSVIGNSPETPAMSLAKLVRTKLLDAKLIPESKADEFLAKLISGSAAQEDWKLWLDLGSEKDKKVG